MFCIYFAGNKHIYIDYALKKVIDFCNFSPKNL